MRFLRTASTARLLAAIGAALVTIAGGAAIAVAATSGGPRPRPAPLAVAVHRALAAPAVLGLSADVTFTNNLVDASELSGQGGSDPLLGASGRLWIGDGRMRLELQSSNGDAEIVAGRGRFFVSDPASHTVYEGALPAGLADPAGRTDRAARRVPTLATIRNAIARLARGVGVSGAIPTDVAGRAAYRVRITPRHGGQLGGVALAFDAARGIPLQLAVYARGNPDPVLALTATHVAYGSVPASTLDIAPPTGERVVRLGDMLDARLATDRGHAVRGAAAVARRRPAGFTLTDPARLAGRSRSSVTLLGAGARATVLVAYGRGLDGLLVIERRAAGGSSGATGLPSTRIDGAPAGVLATPLGSVIELRHAGMRDTVLGAVPAATARAAAASIAAGT